MIASLYKRIAHLRLAVAICLLLALLALFFAFLQSQRQTSMLNVQISLLEGIKQQDIDRAALCEAIKEQQHIIRQEIPLNTTSWLGVTKESCP